GARRVHVKRRTFDLQLGSCQTCLGRNGQLRRAPTSDYHADVLCLQSGAIQRVTGSFGTGLGIGEHRRFRGSPGVAVLGLTDVIQWEHRTSFPNTDALDNPMGVYTNVQ